MSDYGTGESSRVVLKGCAFFPWLWQWPALCMSRESCFSSTLYLFDLSCLINLWSIQLMDWILLWLNSAKAQRSLWFQIEPLAQVNCKLEIFQYFRYIYFQRKLWIWKGKVWSVKSIGYIFGNTMTEGTINVVGLLSWFLPFFFKEIIFVTPSLPNLYNSESAYQVVSFFQSSR